MRDEVSLPDQLMLFADFVFVLDELMMRGRYDIVYVAKDGEGNVGLCRFIVYLRGK